MSVPAKILLVCEEPYHVYQVWYILTPIVLSMPRGMEAFCRTGVQQRLQYCLCQGGCGTLFTQVYRVWSLYRGLNRVLLYSFVPGPFRAGVPGRMAPVGFGCAGRRRAASRVLTYPESERRGVGVESRARGRPSNRRGRPEAARA